MERLELEFPDGWALSTHVNALRFLWPAAPPKSRLCAWVKTFASSMFLHTVGPMRFWEPVVVRVGSERHEDRRVSPRDWVSAPTGPGHTEPFKGAKPRAFSLWLFDVLALGQHPDDEMVDIFPGSGAVTRAWQDYRASAVLRRDGNTQAALFADAP
jgi:hypothetical protein